MKAIDAEQLRMTALLAIVNEAPKPPGRTTLMKFAYLLQTVRGVPLGYRFRLYNYGPYDESVLSDARSAELNGMIESKLVTYQHGYGYEFASTEKGKSELSKHQSEICEWEDDLNWILDQFGNDSASRLELISTIVFALCNKSEKLEGSSLVDRVHDIKPHFSKDAIAKAADEVKGMLDCVECR